LGSAATTQPETQGVGIPIRNFFHYSRLESAMAQAHGRSTGDIVALYPGSFDPIHNGHLDIVRRSAALFDRVIVSIFDRPDKRLLFSTEERVRLVAETTSDIPNVEVATYSTLTVDYAEARGAQAIVRGLRATSDFDFEFQLALMNRHLSKRIEAIFLMTSLEHAHLSSSLIKEIASFGTQIDDLVPKPVAAALQRKREMGR
jgi:pantetheine-phosphate adenylyltransferase